MGDTRVAMHALGVNWNVASPIVSLIDKWISGCGLEYTVSRLKQFKQLYVARQAKVSFKQEKSWIACRPDGYPTGPFGVLMRNFPTVTVLNVLNVYHSFVFDKVTDTQWKKFYESATAEPSNPNGLSVSIPKEVRPWDYSLPPYQVSDYYAAFQVGLTKLTLSREVSARKRYVQQQEILWCDTCLGKGTAGAYSVEVIPQLRAVYGFSARTPGVVRRHYEGVVGSLGSTQETGGKLRVFAIPNLAWQAFLDPLKKYLFRQLRKVREDCSYDQESGANWVQGQLRQGKVAHSIDLSDATNHFPWYLQRDLLQSLKVPLMFRIALERVAKGEYIIPKGMPRLPGEVCRGDGVRTLVFQKGQPLGAGPSFALFAMAHHGLVQSCQSYDKGGDQYRILGDDIVITDSTLASEYLLKLEQLQVPVSKSKTISSGTLAEFAGWLITANHKYKPWKWKNVETGSLASSLQHFSRFPQELLRRDQRRLAGLLWTVLQPLGAGKNPNGIPLSDRYAQLLTAQELIEQMRSDTRWSSHGQTWDVLALLYGSQEESTAPFPRQEGLFLQGLLHGAALRYVETPESNLEMICSGTLSRLQSILDSLLSSYHCDDSSKNGPVVYH